MSQFLNSVQNKDEIKIRDIDANSNSEIQLVAQRMRETLVEVLGEEKGVALYSLQWLEDRVKWHLDSNNTKGRVFLIENKVQVIIGHAIARIDKDASFGYFSTIFVEPKSRRMGVAKAIVEHVEVWFRQNNVDKIIYNTAENHSVLLKFLKSRGFEITHREADMVQLTKLLQS